MGSSAKGGGGSSKSYNYFGDIAGLVCAGEVDELTGVEIDDKLVWSGSLLNSSSPNPAIVTIEGRGVMRFYWGRENQAIPDDILSAAGNNLGHQHPAYSGICYFLLQRFLFGREKTSAPNVRVLVRRKPKQTIITGAATDLNDGQANPIAALAELYTNERFGRGLPISLFDSSSWQATANKAATKHALTYISLYLNSRLDGKAISGNMLSLFDGWHRIKAGSALSELGCFTQPDEINATSLPVIDSDALTAVPSFEVETWDDVKTKYTITYDDREHNYKERSLKHEDPRSRFALGENRPESIQRTDITRADQAAGYVKEMARRFSTPGMTATLSVRAERLLGIRAGQHIRIDIDPQPGGYQLQQVCRVLKITRPQHGAAQLTIESERTLEPVPFTAAPTPTAPPPPPAVPQVDYVRFYEAPTGMADGKGYHVGILASRPDALVTGFATYYDDAPGGDFPRIGGSRIFGLRARLTSSVASAATGPFGVEILDTHNREIIAENPGETAARDDTLLMIVFKVASSGQIQADSGDKAWIEVFSVESLVSTGINLLDVAALRSRQGTPARDFALHDEVWFVPRSALTIVEHADFPGHVAAASNAYFKIQPFTIDDERPLEDCAVRTFNFALNRDLPDNNTVTTTIEWRYKRTPFVPATPTGNTPAGWSTSDPGGSDALWASFAHREISTGNVLGVWSIPTRRSGNTIRFDTSAPNTDLLENDAFIDIGDNNKIYRYNGSAWVASFSPFIKTDGSGRVEGLQKADGTDGYWVMVANAFQIWNGSSAEAPFEVVGGFTYIKNAIIQNAAIGTLKIAGNAVTAPVFAVASTASSMPDNVWTNVVGVGCSIESGQNAFISVSFALSDDGPHLTEDCDIEIRRADSTVIFFMDWTVSQGVTKPISFQWMDANVPGVVSGYDVYLRPRTTGTNKGTPSARSPAISVIHYKR